MCLVSCRPTSVDLMASVGARRQLLRSLTGSSAWTGAMFVRVGIRAGCESEVRAGSSRKWERRLFGDCALSNRRNLCFVARRQSLHRSTAAMPEPRPVPLPTSFLRPSHNTSMFQSPFQHQPSYPDNDTRRAPIIRLNVIIFSTDLHCSSQVGIHFCHVYYWSTNRVRDPRPWWTAV